MIDPTPTQRRCCYEIECFRGVHGRPPTQRELAVMLGISQQGVCKHLHYMAKKGLIAGRGRTLTTHCPVADRPGNR